MWQVVQAHDVNYTYPFRISIYHREPHRSAEKLIIDFNACIFATIYFIFGMFAPKSFILFVLPVFRCNTE